MYETKKEHDIPIMLEILNSSNIDLFFSKNIDFLFENIMSYFNTPVCFSFYTMFAHHLLLL